MTGELPRSTPAQQGPPESLDGVPTGRPSGTHWYREHGHRPASSDGGCWYYAALPADPANGGRFDLPAPDGTCYFANREAVAALERVGRFTSRRKPVPASFIRDRVVSTVMTSSLPARAVNLVSKRAATLFGVNGELFTMADYSVPQAWAAAIHEAGHEAMVYTPRFSPHGRAIAAFGPAGPDPKDVVSSRPLRDVLADALIAMADIPSADALTFIDPPAPDA